MKQILEFKIYMFTLFVLLKMSDCEEVDSCGLCKFNHHHKSTQQKVIQRLQPLCGKRYSMMDQSIFSYSFGVCTSATVAETRPDFQHIGMIQVDSSVSPSKTFKLGSVQKADLKAGTNWMLLEYSGGDAYPISCNKSSRSTHVMLLCDLQEHEGRLEYLEEDNTETNNNCYYLFQLTHSAMCQEGGRGVVGGSDGWSVGTIVCIILFSSTGGYLLFGVLFMRFVRGAQGFQQIPHFAFWRELGHLQADGCNFICRCSDKHINNYSQDIQADNRTSLVYEDGDYNHSPLN